MAIGSTRVSKGVLEPNERISEVLFGLIMVLTFTGSLSVADAGRDDVRAMLIGALGCNLAWGLIDGIFCLMGSLAEKGSSLKTLQAVRAASDPKEAERVVAGALSPWIASALAPGDLAAIHRRLKQLPDPPERARLSLADWAGALAVFLLVFLSTFPVAVPFLFMSDVPSAMRASNAVAIVLLFGLGFAYGRSVGRSPWGFGASMVVLGSVLVAITIALGG